MKDANEHLYHKLQIAVRRTLGRLFLDEPL